LLQFSVKEKEGKRNLRQILKSGRELNSNEFNRGRILATARVGLSNFDCIQCLHKLSLNFPS